MGLTRRQLLKSLAGASVALPFYDIAMGRQAAAMDGRASRFIVFYFPDGVAGPSQDGDPSLWHCRGSEFDFELGETLSHLGRFRDECVFFNGLSMGGTDSGSHPGGAKKLLTGADGGNGESIDQYLARTVGSGASWRHLNLGCMANHNGASGDKHISYSGPGATVAPEDNPLIAFDRIFAGALPGGAPDNTERDRSLSVLDGAMADLADLRSALGETEAVKLNQHLEAFREVEARIASDVGPPVGTCEDPALDSSGFDASELYEPGRFPAMLRMQTDLMVQAMACGLTQVGVIQGSHHTSELIMSRFEGSDMYDAGYDMRSHQASHYGASHDRDHREFTDYVDQRGWWVQQFRYLLEELAARPEGDGTMLDHSTILLCSEVCDGNTHLHDNMPFVVAGRAGGAISTGRLLQYDYMRHSNLLVALGRSMGADLNNFGQESFGPLPGLLSS